jgi:hypothetical protein
MTAITSARSSEPPARRQHGKIHRVDQPKIRKMSQQFDWKSLKEPKRSLFHYGSSTL